MKPFRSFPILQTLAQTAEGDNHAGAIAEPLAL